MRRSLPLLGLAAALWTAPARAADEDDPEYGGRKCSEYVERLLKLMTTDKPADEEARQKAIDRREKFLDVLELFGPKPSRVVPAVVKVMREDPEPAVRAYAARWPGQTAAKFKELDVKPGDALDALARTLKEDRAKEVREAAAASIGTMA